MKKILLFFMISILSFQTPFAQEQEPKKDVSEMTKEDVLDLTYDELLEMPFEDVMKLAEIVGVSLDELYEMILNKDLVSASKKVESSFVSPLSTSVISRDDIIASGARTIEEALRMVPGMIVREKSNGNFDVHIRGNDNLPPNHMFLYSENSVSLVMIDNRPVYNYVHGGTFWETLPIDFEDIDRIEVVRGPSSALYGPNAVSGVVNIITRKQESTDLDVQVNAELGNQSTALTTLGLGKAVNDKLAFRVTGNFQQFGRSTEEVWVHKANGGEGGFIPISVLDTLSDPGDPAYKVFDPSDDVNDMFPEPGLSRQRYGGNAYIFITPSEEVVIDLKGGYQYSQVISSTMGDNPTAQAGRVSNTGYTDVNATVYGFHAQVNLLSGWQDIVRGDTGFKIDIYNLNANLEYDIELGNLSLRPGVAFQSAKYDDTPYLSSEGQGFLNQERDFTTTAFTFRADYLAFERLRFIAAVRGDKYSTHDDLYFSYQGIISYNLHDMHNIRFVASRANRSPFLVDTYADYYWVRNGRPNPGYIYFKGQENLDLLTMDMFELGYRIKPSKSLQADFEFFYTRAESFGALYPDSVDLNGAQLGLDRPWVRMTFDNINLTSQQMGITASVSYVASENLFFKLFGTYQESKLENIIPYTQDETIQLMLEEAFLTYSLDGTTTHSTSFPNKRESGDNEATPSFYGGLIVNYTPLEKLHINLNSYYYSAQKFANKYGVQDIDAKLILNLKASYQLMDPLTLYLNARNLLGAAKEFGYMEEIGPVVTFGLNLKL